ncbi:Anthranilate phosphoribosyltransferase [uncultured archaeon]|nr:Anthranilate phosphoribosyltransferase [uncultured archaeon]
MESLAKLTGKKDLTTQEAEELMDKMMSGQLTGAQAAALLVALKMKGESEDEITAFARVMRRNAVRISPRAQALVDTCGTGGDSSLTFNISTAAAFIAAGAGIPVAKHGNRSVSGKSGSADVLEQLGVRLLQPPEVEKCIDRIGIGFMFAPYFHPAMKNVAQVRKELGIRTVFNILGPLTNPAGASAQLIGVFDPSFTGTFARVLSSLGTNHALIVHSEGMDEIGLGKTTVAELKGGKTSAYELDAGELGFSKSEVPKADSARESSKIILGVLGGEKGPALDVSLLNAAAAIYVGGKTKTIEKGIELARDSVDSGKAGEKLEQLAGFSG